MPTPKRSTSPSAKTSSSTGRGWKAVANRKKETEENRANNASDNIREMWMADGETAQIQFLDDEPICMDGHTVMVKKKRKFLPCQLATQKHCLMCQAGEKTTWKAAFKILDYRGTWNKDKDNGKGKEPGGFMYDKPVEKLWYVSQTLAGQIHKMAEKKKKDLTEYVFEVTRSGAGPKDTSYNFELATDEDENTIDPIMDYEQEFPSTEELTSPPTDKQLAAIGFGSEEED